MVSYGILDPSPVKPPGDELLWQVPAYVAAMLQNVHLIRSRTAPPVEHSGDFWYWMLTPFGLTIMRILVRASLDAFSYAETFMQPDRSEIPQLVLLETITTAMQDQLTDSILQPDWVRILVSSQFLHEQHVLIDPAAFHRQMDHLTVQVKLACYDMAGYRIYTPPGKFSVGSQAAGH